MLQIKKIISFTNCSKCQVLCIVFKEKINLKTKTFIENTLFQLKSFQCHQGEPVCACILNKTAPEIPPRVRDTATAPSSERWSQWHLRKSKCTCFFPFSVLFHLLQAIKTLSNPIFKQPCTVKRELPWNYWASSGIPTWPAPGSQVTPTLHTTSCPDWRQWPVFSHFCSFTKCTGAGQGVREICFDFHFLQHRDGNPINTRQ